MKYTLEITNVSKDTKITLQNRSLRSQADIDLQENYIQYTYDIFSSRIVLPKNYISFGKRHTVYKHILDFLAFCTKLILVDYVFSAELNVLTWFDSQHNSSSVTLDNDRTLMTTLHLVSCSTVHGSPIHNKNEHQKYRRIW